MRRLRYQIGLCVEVCCRAVAQRLPRPIVYWCAIRLLAHATTGQYGSTDPSQLSVMGALERWSKGVA